MKDYEYIEKSFEDWFSEYEDGIAISRDEQMFEELQMTGDYTQTLIKWLKKAHNIGFREGEIMGYNEGVDRTVEKMIAKREGAINDYTK